MLLKKKNSKPRGSKTDKHSLYRLPIVTNRLGTKASNEYPRHLSFYL